MYSIENCRPCTLSKSFINNNNIQLRVKDISNDIYDQELAVLSKQHPIENISFPQMFIKYKGKDVYYGLPLSHLALINNIPTRVGLHLSKHDKEILKRRESDYTLNQDLKNKKFKI